MQRINLRSARIVEGRPTIQPDETLVYRAFEGKASGVLLGLVLTFIPPFLWGPLVILITLYMGRHSGVMVTNRRLVAFHKYFKPRKYSVLEIPLAHLINVKCASLTRGDMGANIVDRLLGSGDVELQWESEKGTRAGLLPTIKRPKRLVRAIEQARQSISPSA